MTLVVTGSGRSGTHWLAGVLDHFVEAYHEPKDVIGDVIVDCRRVNELPGIAERHRVMHLIRDGRDVVRSQHEAASGRLAFDKVCERWAKIIDKCKPYPYVRLEDLVKPADPYPSHRLPKWPEWDASLTDTFWDICGEQMERHGYSR